MRPPMLHTAYKVDKVRNKYGDYEGSTENALPCHFREITALIDGLADNIQSDALAWFMPDSGIVKGDVISFESTLYKVERLTKARRLRSTNVEFIKTELMRYKS